MAGLAELLVDSCFHRKNWTSNDLGGLELIRLRNRWVCSQLSFPKRPVTLRGSSRLFSICTVLLGWFPVVASEKNVFVTAVQE